MAAITAHYGASTDGYKLIYYYGQALGAKGAVDQPTPPEWELFDLQKDFREMKSIYGDPTYAKVEKELKCELKRLRLQYRDST